MDLVACTYEVDRVRLTGYFADGAPGHVRARRVTARTGAGAIAPPDDRCLAHAPSVSSGTRSVGVARALRCHEAAEDRASFIQEMNQAAADRHVFGGVGHSYTNREIDTLAMPGIAYKERADRRAWALMLSMFGEVF